MDPSTLSMIPRGIADPSPSEKATNDAIGDALDALVRARDALSTNTFSTSNLVLLVTACKDRG